MNPWISHLKGCAQAYWDRKAERAVLPRRRLNTKSPDEALYVKPRPPEPRPPAPNPQPRASRPAPAEVGHGTLAPQGAPRPALPHARLAPLLSFANAGRAYLRGLAAKRATAARFYQELASVGDLREALREVGLPVKTSVASFVRAFPEFKLEVPANGGTSYVSLR